MKSIVPMLEQELEGAVEIKDKDFLHRYITLMAENFVQKEDHVTETGLIRSDIQVLAESMKQSFDRMDKRFEAVDKRFEDLLSGMDRRFEAVDKRFEDMNHRFNMQFIFMGAGFTILAALMSLYRFFGEFRRPIQPSVTGYLSIRIRIFLAYEFG